MSIFFEKQLLQFQTQMSKRNIRFVVKGSLALKFLKLISRKPSDIDVIINNDLRLESIESIWTLVKRSFSQCKEEDNNHFLKRLLTFPNNSKLVLEWMTKTFVPMHFCVEHKGLNLIKPSYGFLQKLSQIYYLFYFSYLDNKVITSKINDTTNDLYEILKCDSVIKSFYENLDELLKYEWQNALFNSFAASGLYALSFFNEIYFFTEKLKHAIPNFQQTFNKIQKNITKVNS